MKLSLSYPIGAFAAAMEDRQHAMAAAATEAVREAGVNALDRGRLSIARARGRFGKGWQQGLRLLTFPRRGVSLGAAALVYHKIRYAGIFEDSGTIHGKPVMWLPLRSAPKTIGGRKLTPKLFVQMVGPLYKVEIPGRLPILVAKIASKTAKGRRVTNINLAAMRRGASEGGRTVPVFVGIPVAEIPKTFDVTSAVERAAAELPELYVRNLRDI